MNAHLIIIEGKHVGRKIPLSPTRLVLGRGEDADVRSEGGVVSREHCAIQVVDGEVVIEDLASRNGTLVNGQVLQGRRIGKSGDTVRIGSLLIEIVVRVDSTSEPAYARNPSEADSAELRSSCSDTVDADQVLDRFFNRENG